MCRKIMIIVAVIALIAMAGGAQAATSVFQDILDTPAMKTKLVDSYLYNGIAKAGNRLVSVGQYGTILYSDDQGKKWIQAEVPVSANLTAVVFPTPQKGWAVGEDHVVLHSEDGGLKWSKQFDGKIACQLLSKYYKEHPLADQKLKTDIERIASEGSDKPLLDVYFENEKSGFIVGAFNLIFRTEDGGKNWTPWCDRTENPSGFHLYSIKAIDGDLFISGEQGLLMKLDRKTSRFRKIDMPYPGTYFGVLGKRGVMVAYGMRGNLYRSGNNGATWKKIETGLTATFTGGMVTAKGQIILLTNGGNILLSNEDGTAFNQVKVDGKISGTSVEMLDSDTIVVAGFGGMRVLKLK